MKTPFQNQQPVSRYLWRPGMLIDMTCAGCASTGCNRCRTDSGYPEMRALWTSQRAAGKKRWEWAAKLRRLLRALRLI